MPATYEPIATVTLGTSAANFSFTSIPSTYTDLRLVIVPTKPSGTLAPRVRFNSDAGFNYSFINIWGDGATVYSNTSNRSSYADSIYLHYDGYPVGSNVGFGTMDIFSYADSTFKTVFCEQLSDRNGSGSIAKYVNLWRNTSAITSILVFEDFGSFGAGTTATLYGIKNA